jgi:hypothetical protein
LPSDCNVEGYSYDPNQLPTPTPSTTASVAQFGCTGLFGDAVTDEYFHFGGIRNGKPYYTSDGISFSLGSCGGSQTLSPMTMYWDNVTSRWVMEVTSSGTACGYLTGSTDPNFPVATGSTNWVSVNTGSGCPCAQFFNLIDTIGLNTCAYRFRLASGATYTQLSQICGSQYFFVGGLTYPFGFTANPIGSSLVDTIVVGTSWYSNSTLTTPLGDGFYMIPTVINAASYTRYWIQIQGGVVVQSGIC